MVILARKTIGQIAVPERLKILESTRSGERTGALTRA
jgi:hypothetical protein